QGFCIVSSDSDYTRLCTRIREDGFFVMGMGRKTTPEAFVKACDVFVRVENLTPPKKPAQPQKAAAKPPSVNDKLVKLLNRAFDIAASDDGWVHLGALGQVLHRIDPSFDSRTYNYNSLSLLIKSMPNHFTVKTEKKTGPSAIYVSMKNGSK
ncbi:MAG: NYN domain-containing protein, partial [Anaerolineae bacterium]|nr:NYN domain-containing protein [Anaerolineae bacterium]